jgi:hypothetical protein
LQGVPGIQESGSGDIGYVTFGKFSRSVQSAI